VNRALALALFLVAGLMIASCSADDSGRFQNVGGDYGRTFINSIKSDETETVAASNSSDTLWDWGGSPKGTMVLDGNLISDPRYAPNKLNVVENYLDESFMDPYNPYSQASAYTYTDSVTGEVVPTYMDPTTGEPYYKYTDPVSGKLLYVYFNPLTGVPTRTVFAPDSDSAPAGQEGQGTFTLPSIFR
jgi:hypothetical protein